MTRFVRWRWFALLCCCLGVFANAESLSSMRSRSLPALTAGEPPLALVSLDDRLVALGRAQAWILEQDAGAWTSAPFQVGGLVQAYATDGRAAFLVMSDRVVRLVLVDGRLATRPLPALPFALTNARATTAKDIVAIVANDPGGEPVLLQLRFADANATWTTTPMGTEASATSIVIQTGAVFVTFAGAPETMRRWSSDRGWTVRANVPGEVVANEARPIGQAHVLYLVRHPQGTVEAMTYQTITGSWATLPGAAMEGVALATPWHNGIAWTRANGDRVDVAITEVEGGRQLLKWLDWVVIVVYLTSMLGIGLYFYLREKRASTSDFFVGGRSIPFWAAGVSLYVANTSSISYIAIPAKSFETNWQYMTNNLIAVLGLMFVAVWIVPLLRRLDLMSVFQYLEIRFHPVIRVLASALFIAVQIGSRMSVILFLPALAIATITGIDVVWSVLIMGGFTIVYTAMGGMKAVIWTDFVQLFVKMGGAIFAIGFIVWKLDGGFAQLLTAARVEDKTKLFDFSFDLTKATVWGFIFLVIFDVVLTFPKDQVLMQRTLSTKSDREAGRSVWAMAALMIPGGFIFYGIGTALFVYYQANPERMNPLLSIDATFPLFIAAELPMGVTGLIVAGILAAAMATLSSIMNSVATLASVDFYEKLVRQPDAQKSVRFAEAMTIVAGLLAIGAALLLSRYDVHSLFDVSIELAGLLGGGFAGAYTLGMFTRRANWQGVAIGVASSIVLTTYAWSKNLVHPYFYLAISILLCIVIGYAASWLFPAPTRSLRGLTIHTKGPREGTAAAAAIGR